MSDAVLVVAIVAVVGIVAIVIVFGGEFRVKARGVDLAVANRDRPKEATSVPRLRAKRKKPEGPSGPTIAGTEPVKEERSGADAKPG